MTGFSEVVLDAVTTSVSGRFTVSGSGFQLVSDAPAAFGGPGQAATANDLLIAALLTCAINVFRGSTETDLAEQRQVKVVGRLVREDGDTGLGRLELEAAIGGVDQAGADRLVEAYMSTCRIYKTLKPVLDLTISARPAAPAGSLA